MRISRRIFLAGSTSLILTAPVLSKAIASNKTKNNLVIIMLRGGMDGLTAVPFIGNDILTKARPDIGISKPIPITSNFALHPILKNYKSKHCDISSSVSSPLGLLLFHVNIIS